MTVYIDADGCPVVELTLCTAKKHGADCVIVCDTSHEYQRDSVRTVIVEKGADSADFKLVNLLKRGDIAVTQDYGLAAMCLARGAYAINQNGLVFSERNIDGLLFSRSENKKLQRAGGRLKGPPKRTTDNDKAFLAALEKLLDRAQKENGQND